jgi:hypothetical protein
MNNTKTLAIVAVLMAATLVVGTFATMITTTQSAYAYAKKLPRQDDKKTRDNGSGNRNGNTITALKCQNKGSASGFDTAVNQECENLICTHPGNNATCTQEGLAAATGNAISSQQPPPTNSFTITGTGTGSSASFVCNPPVPPGLTISIDFSAQRDGTVSGTYTISTNTGFLRQGTITDGTTDGNTYTLSGVNLAVCADNQGNLPVAPMTISGDCGDRVTITYRDPNTAGTFTGNVQCTLT